MFKIKLLPLFVILVVAMMGVTSIAPAYAAKKVIDNKFDNDYNFPRFICGQITVADVNQKGHVVVWDNNKYSAEVNTEWIFTDPITGELVGKAHKTLINVGDFDDSPRVIQSNTVVTCVGSGNVFDLHFGFTLHKDGTVTSHS